MTHAAHESDQAYDVIERMYPHETRMELFARQARPGWAAWGNHTMLGDRA